MPRRKKRERQQVGKTEEEAEEEQQLLGSAVNTCQVRTSPQVGRYLVARRRVKEGEIIFKDEPLVVGPCQDTKPVCIGCCTLLKQDTPFKHRCAGCGWPKCRDDCPGMGTQLGHTTSECKLLCRLPPPNDNSPEYVYNHVTPLRSLLLRSDRPAAWEQLSRMESHDEIRKGVPCIWEKNQITVVNVIQLLGGDFAEELVHTVCGILEVNSFSVGELGVEARALYPRAYLLQHDCTPNISHIDVSLVMFVRAAMDIPPGTPFGLAYTSTLYGTVRRRRELKESKFFDCCCRRCSDRTELGTYLSGVKCTSCQPGYLLPQDPLVADSEWKCTFCEATTPHHLPLDITDRSSNEIEVLKDGTIEDYEKILAKYESILHPNHSTLFKSKFALSQMYGRAESSIISYISPEMLRRKSNICRDLLKVFDVIEPGLSRVRGVTQYELHAPLLLLTRLGAVTGSINNKQVRKDLRLVKDLLTKSTRILSFESPGSLEGMTYVAALDALRQTEFWPI